MKPDGRSFAIANDTFLLDGEKMQIMGCSYHYSRSTAATWDDRLQRLAAMGCNTIQTYVPWNWHEAEPGVWDFKTGARNIGAFLDLCKAHGLLVIVRAGPYMCGEWEFGGLPSWLIQQDPEMKVRTWDEVYIARVDSYFNQLMPQIKPHLYNANPDKGSVIMVQVENEYGSYGDVSTNPADKKYLEHLVELASSLLGNSAVGKFEAVQLYTDDGGNSGFMTRGSLNGSSVYTVGDGGPGPDATLCAAMADFNPPGLNPCLDDEYYAGWITHWGSAVANTSTQTVVKYLDALLGEGHSVSIYMAHGGSNFGPFSGANGGGKSYQSTIQSYDYNSPVAEGGEHGYGPDGDKYEGIKSVFSKYTKGGAKTLPPEPPLGPRYAYAPIKLTQGAPMLDPANLKLLATGGVATLADTPTNMEAYGQRYGFILYSATMPPMTKAAKATNAAGQGTEQRLLEIFDYPRDRAQVFVDGHEACPAIFRPNAAPVNLTLAGNDGRFNHQQQSHDDDDNNNNKFWNPDGGEKLQLLVENMGRMTFGSGLWDPKGITEAVQVDGTTNITGTNAWAVHNLDLADFDAGVAKLPFGALPSSTESSSSSSSSSSSIAGGPYFLRGTLPIAAGRVGDTYLLLTGPTYRRGFVWINGFFLGRYWPDEGPQKTMYVPASLLKEGNNDVVLLELHPAQALAQASSGGGVPLSFVALQDFTGLPMVCDPDSAVVSGEALAVYSCGAGGAHQSWKLVNRTMIGDAEGGGRAMTTSNSFHLQLKDSSSLCLAAQGEAPAEGPQGPASSSSSSTAVVVPCDASAAAQTFSWDAQSKLFTLSNGEALQLTAPHGPGAVFGAAPADPKSAPGAQWSLLDTPSHFYNLQVADGGLCLSACKKR
eukprot:g1809.t1